MKMIVLRLFRTRNGRYAKLWLAIYSLGASLTFVGSAHAEWLPSDSEMALLPPYCAARFNEKSPAFSAWKETLGPDFIHIHHYCAGLNFVARAYRQISADGRKGTLGAAIREMDYVLEHAQQGFTLRPDILMNRAIALSMLGRDAEAVGDLQKAIELNPTLAGAYRTLADLQTKLQQKAKALQTVTEGLRNAPNNKGLQRRYDELGGKKPYPEPYVKIESPGPAAPTDSATQANPPEAGTPEQAGPNAPSNSQPALADRKAKDATSQSATPPAPDGAGKSPWCRFCPD